MKNIELLAPAGDMNKCKTAFRYGADAVYLSGKRFGLRAFAGNFEENELEEQIKMAHSLNKKVYVTLNIIPHNVDFNGLAGYVKYLDSIKADAVIVADMGIMEVVKQNAPNLEIHISTQASITNKYTALQYVNMGAKRLVLARELTLEEIKEIRDYLPKDIVLEAFVHGAMCMAYSGRCLLSNYLTGRDANRGACVQACRWEYTIHEKNRDNEKMEIQEDDRGTYILNSKDLNMIKHIDELYKAGVNSFKIEGRMKSEYYVATVVNAYRRAINLYLKSPENFECPKELEDELFKASHRKYTTGFYFKGEDKEYLKNSKPVQSHKFMAIVLEDSKDGYALIEQRNRFKVGDKLEILSTGKNFNKLAGIEAMKDKKENKVEDALIVQQKLYVKTNIALTKGDMLRKEN